LPKSRPTPSPTPRCPQDEAAYLCDLLDLLEGPDSAQPWREAAWLCPILCPARQLYLNAPAVDLCAELDRFLEDATADYPATPSSFNLSNVRPSLHPVQGNPGNGLVE
jgi:hypothetical protein